MDISPWLCISRVHILHQEPRGNLIGDSQAYKAFGQVFEDPPERLNIPTHGHFSKR